MQSSKWTALHATANTLALVTGPEYAELPDGTALGELAEDWRLKAVWNLLGLLDRQLAELL